MKILVRILVALAALSACLAHGQDSFIYDQQSSTTDTYTANVYTAITPNQPFGQSFTPALPQVGFVRLWIGQGVPADTNPAMLAVNLRANSITGQILGTSQVTLTPGSVGPVDFLFNTPVTVTPGTSYYLQPEVQTGGFWDIGSLGNVYPNGLSYTQGAADPSYDLFFREGILVPEPSVIGLIITGTALTLVSSKRKRSAGTAP